MKVIKKMEEIKRVDNALYNTIKLIVDDSIDRSTTSHNYIIIKTFRTVTSCNMDVLEFIALNKLIYEILTPLDYDMESFNMENILLEYMKSRVKYKHGQDNRTLLKFGAALCTYGISYAVELAINAKHKKALKILEENKKNGLGDYETYKNIYKFYMAEDV